MRDYAVTREQKRYIAKYLMKKEGLRNICRHSYHTLTGPNGISIQVRDPSFFATHWREYAEKRKEL